MPLKYSSFPLMKFWEIFKNEELLEPYGIKKEDWEKLKEEWMEKHPSPETHKIVEISRKIILEDIRLKQFLILVKVASVMDEGIKDYYDVLGIKFHEKFEDRITHLNKNISKSKQKIEIFLAQRKKLQEEIQKNTPVQEKETASVNEILASFEIAGINIGNHEEMTLGRYDGLNSAFEKKARKLKNGRKS